jgi:NAD+-dependent farnesol dehydrogenase
MGKILILGGTGHLGSALSHYLVEHQKIRQNQIRIFFLAGSPTNGIQDLPNLELYPGNVLNVEDVVSACEDIEIVYHMIGNTTFDPLKKKIQWLINVEGTRNVLEAVKKSSTIKKMCYISTVNTLGIPDPMGSIGNFENSDPYQKRPGIPKAHSFNSPKEALSFIEVAHHNKIPNWEKKIGIGYFDSKLAAQELVNFYVQKFQLSIVSVLPGTMFGPYDYLIGNGMYLIQLNKNGMPGVLKGGFPLAHVMDVVRGIELVMEKGKNGSKYIITGKEEDNLYQIEMVKIISDVLRQKYPNRKIKTPTKVFRKRMAMIGAIFSEIYAKIFKKPCILSRDSVSAGSFPSFYSYKKAKDEIGYVPEFSFKQAVEEMLDYYEEKNLLDVKHRYLDKK